MDCDAANPLPGARCDGTMCRMSDDVFFAAHTGLPREAPGSIATTALLYRLVGVRGRPRVLDVGAGTGPATVVLAELGAQVTAIDTHQPFLDELRSRAITAGVENRISIANLSMDSLNHLDDTFDVIWAEGSAYIIGVDNALTQWRRLLTPGGVIVLTDANWLTTTPAPEAAAFWHAAAPDMRTLAESITAAQSLGWVVAATYLLPDSDWDEYYTPLAANIARLRRERPDDGNSLDGVEEEIALRRRFGTDYGYVGYVLRPATPRAT
jgi:SAM-dependent methyltransferase